MTAFNKLTIPAVFNQFARELTPFQLALMRAQLDQNLNLDAILNRGIRFEDNCDMRVVDFTSSATPDAENTVTHGLGKTPVGYLVASIDKAAIVYKSATPATKTSIYLKVNVASVVTKIIVF